MTLEEIKSHLCYYDLRNPDRTVDKDEAKEHIIYLKKYNKVCCCDNCYHGLTKLAEELLKYYKQNKHE